MMYQLHKEVNAEDYPDGRTRVWGKCKITSQPHECWVQTAELELWRSGAKIQDAMPTVSAGDREFLKSGISPDGWDELFGDPA
jgi:hypothetical protein